MHQGKHPLKDELIKIEEPGIEVLKSQLGELIKNEEFEKAAELRDRINDFKIKGN